MAVRRPPTTFSDEISAADLAANSVTASELADNAVDTAAIADDAVTNAKMGANAITATELATNAVTTAKITDANITTAKVADNAVTSAKVANAVFTDNVEVKPHIKPGILQPAIAGKLLDGTTNHSGNYGTAQSDGHSYYYTDIKGSKPIKDPRIGAHFGSQRHKIKSMQLLEQETATHGKNVYSIDGREWARACGDNIVSTYGVRGHCVTMAKTTTDTNFIEVVGYWNDVNIDRYTDTDNRYLRVSLNGGTVQETDYNPGAGSSLYGRYVDSGSILRVTFNSTPTLGINTIKIFNKVNDESNIHSIELIVQDIQDFTATNATNILTSAGHTLTNGDQIKLTGSDLPNGLNATTKYYVIGASGNNFQVSGTSGGSAVTFSDDGTGSRTFTALNNIQIPAQNVVSYGKKFSVSAAATHYDPFTSMSYGGSGINASTLGGLIDTATSLGMENWKAGGANYHRPFNGGRVVKWVASDGTIKTSVTMMSPNAQIMDGTASNPVSNAEVIAGTNAETINFDNTAIDHSLSEVAKTFHIREFGNGAANGGTGAHQADVSMLSGTTDNIAYVMDDGLTSFNGYDMEQNNSHPTAIMGSANGDGFYLTWIGTGITVNGMETLTSPLTLAQNLPYGTHFMRVEKTSGTDSYVAIDGIGGDRNEWPLTEINEVTFHQPKMPPIPEDACIIADYMLMADYVKQTTATFTGFSKGMRLIQASRDVFYSTPSGTLVFQPSGGNSPRPGVTPHGVQGASGQVLTAKLPFFGTTAQGHGDRGTRTTTLNGTAKTVTNLQHGSQDKCDVHTLDSGVDLGMVTVSEAQPSGAYVTTGFAVATPIHTSHHYQTFETPYLHELVGGDRNMEQTNLIVTADGKSWDEVTRDTSYISPNFKANIHRDGGSYTSESVWVWDVFRGKPQYSAGCVLKDFVPAYDRLVCLVDGKYRFNFQGAERNTNANAYWYFQITGNAQIGVVNKGAGTSDRQYAMPGEQTFEFKRGDWIKIIAYYISGDDIRENTFTINKVS